MYGFGSRREAVEAPSGDAGVPTVTVGSEAVHEPRASERRARRRWNEAQTAALSSDMASICNEVPAAPGVTSGRVGFVHSLSAGVGRRPLLAALACMAAGRAGAARAAPARPGDAVTWPAVRLLDGRTLDAAHWQGQVGVVVFWSTTCPFCRRHNQHVDKLHRAAQATGAPLRVLGVARDRDAAVVQRYAQAQGYGFAITQDVAPLAAALAPRNVIPLTAVVGRDGRLAQVLPGEMFEEDVMELLDLARAAPRARS
jgi:thiol-disulfide isomerase/thioredoxin